MQIRQTGNQAQVNRNFNKVNVKRAGAESSALKDKVSIGESFGDSKMKQLKDAAKKSLCNTGKIGQAIMILGGCTLGGLAAGAIGGAMAFGVAGGIVGGIAGTAAGLVGGYKWGNSI